MKRYTVKTAAMLSIALLSASTGWSEEPRRSTGEILGDLLDTTWRSVQSAGEAVRGFGDSVVPRQPGAAPAPVVVPTAPPSAPSTICIGYGTEKAEWIKPMAAEFTKANPQITVQLIGVGSFEGARAIYEKTAGVGGAFYNGNIAGEGLEFARGQITGNKVTRCQMTAWSPASSLFRNYAATKFMNSRATGGQLPAGFKVNDLYAAEAESLVKSPMVYAVWKENTLNRLVATYNAEGSGPKIDINKLSDPETIAALSKTMTLKRIYDQQALKDTAQRTRPLAFTDILRSNSGFSMMYILAGETSHAVDPDLGILPETMDPSNTDYWGLVLSATSKTFGQNLRSLNNFGINSTNDLMKKFISDGPGTAGGIVTYENLALYMGSIPNNNGDTYHIIYPSVTLIADHPYYVLNLPGNSPDQKKAAFAFMKFLRSEPAQEFAVQSGFRPGVTGINSSVASAQVFMESRTRGVILDLSKVGTPVPTFVDPFVISNIEQGWKDNILSTLCSVPANIANPLTAKPCEALSR